MECLVLSGTNHRGERIDAWKLWGFGKPPSSVTVDQYERLPFVFHHQNSREGPKSLPELIDELVIWFAHDVLWRVFFIVMGGAGLLVQKRA